MRMHTLEPARLYVLNGLAVIALGVFVGCGATATPASFAPGGGNNPLDGATIADDGQNYEIQLSSDNSVGAIENLDTGERLLFDSIDNDSVAVPREVGFGNAGANSISFDRETGLVSVSVDAPVVGRQSFSGVVDLNTVPLFGRVRLASQSGEFDCDSAVAAVDNFCAEFDGSEDELRTELTALALQLAADSGAPPEFNGFIEDAVNQIVDVIGDICGAWSEMRNGVPGESNGVDPCTLI